MVRERSGLTNQFLHPPTAGDSLELEMKYFPIKLSTDFFTCPVLIGYKYIIFFYNANNFPSKKIYYAWLASLQNVSTKAKLME